MPKAPPTSGATTRTRSASIPSTAASSARARCGDWLPSQTVRRPGSVAASAISPRGSSAAGASRGWRSETLACPAALRVSGVGVRQVSRARTASVPPGAVSAGRGSISTQTDSAASVAAAAVSATTSATGAPTDVTTSIASAAGGRGRISGIKGLTEVGPRLAKSAPVKMAATPGRAAASAVSIRAIRPCASGLRTKAAWRQSAIRMSSVNRPRPVRSARSSTRRRACPTPPADAVGFSNKPDLALRNLTGGNNLNFQASMGRMPGVGVPPARPPLLPLRMRRPAPGQAARAG